MYASSSLPTRASVDRPACASTGGVPTFAVSWVFLGFCFFSRARFSLQCTAQLDNVFTAMQCPTSMEYDACRTGCVDDCVSIQTLPGDWSVATGNESSCMDIPTEGCFCTGGTVLHHGRCLSPEACQQCVDQRGRTYTVGQHLCTVHSEALYALTS